VNLQSVETCLDYLGAWFYLKPACRCPDPAAKLEEIINRR